MGILPDYFIKIHDVLQNENIQSGKVLEFGSQCLMGDFTDKRIKDLLDEKGSKLDYLKHFKISDVVFAKELYEAIGFQYYALDFLEYEHCLNVDLNHQNIPNDLIGEFELVTNFGTTEHIFNQYNCYKNIHNATSENGIMLHHVPISRSVDHGLYNTQPNFFLSLAVANDYSILKCDIMQEGRYYDLLNIDTYADIDWGLDTSIWVIYKKNTNTQFQAAQQGNFPNQSNALKTYDFDYSYIQKLYELSMQGISIDAVMEIIAERKVVFYGAGGNSRNFLSIERIRKNVLAVSDVDEKKYGQNIFGVPIISPKEISSYSDQVIVTIDADKDIVKSFIKGHSDQLININFLDIPSH